MSSGNGVYPENARHLDRAHWEIEFDKAGGLVDDGGLAGTVGEGGPTDLFVFSPGWNTGRDSARELSNAMFGLIADALPPDRRASTGFATVLWPSLLFPEDEPAADGPVLAGPAAGWGASELPPLVPAPEPSTGAELVSALALAFPEQRDDLVRIGQLLDTRPREMGRLSELHRLASCLVTTPNHAVDDDGESIARTARTRVALESLALLAPGAGGRPGDLFGTLWDGGRELTRVLSYYEMKNRAGLIGQAGLGPLLGRLHRASPGLRVHLVGHSFGARLIGFALAGLPSSATPVKSLVAVQGALSHFSFASELPIAPSRAGALAEFASRVDGPLLATFSTADRALGWWYPNATALVSQHDRGRRSASARELGYRWGALGHDGYQHGEVVSRRLEPAGSWYDWQAGTFYRMDASLVINRDLSWLAGAHSDIRKPELAWAAVSAAGLGRRAGIQPRHRALA
jgi:hypothetical protein